jgi:SAM-dependent methyltransferase
VLLLIYGMVRLLMDVSFEELISQACTYPVSGWDFSFIADRWQERGPAWAYGDIVRARLPGITSLLDMGTGGGEFLASLAPLPRVTWATEGYPPNVPLAAARLRRLGARLVHIAAEGGLPFGDAAFELVINRHAFYQPVEVFRVLTPGGHYITQQVGDGNNTRINELLAAPQLKADGAWNAAHAAAQLAEAGFEIIQTREDFPETRFTDVGAVVYYLRAIPWQIPGFTVEAYRQRLLSLHHKMQAQGGLVVQSHRFVIEAVKK